MSVYDAIREGIQEDWRKAESYDSMKAALEKRLGAALENPDKDAWMSGFHTGYEACMRRMRGEFPMNETDQWERFKASRNQAK